jgi:hypothetical protein
MENKNEKLFELNGNELWFKNFYRPQLEQAQRAQRTGTAWTATDGVKTYNTLTELDAEADVNQNQIRALKAQIAEQGGM